MRHLFKFLLIFLGMLLYSTAKSQTRLTLVLKTEVPIDSAYIVHFTDKEGVWFAFTDTLYVRFNTTAVDFYHINYKTKDKIYNVQAYLDTGDVTVKTRIVNEKLVIDSVTGSPMFHKTRKWNEAYAGLKEKRDSVAIDSFLLKSYEENLDNIFSFRIGSTFLNIHQNSTAKLFVLFPLIAMQTDELKTRFGFSILHDRLNGLTKNHVIKLESFKLLNLKNKYVTVKGQGSRFTILDFWFVACLPCVADHLKMPGLLPQLRKNGVEFLSISNDESYKTWKKYLSAHQFNWMHYKKRLGEQTIIDQLGISSYPTYILLDEKGKILYNTYSLKEVLKQVNIEVKN